MKNLSLLTLVMVISASAYAAPKKKATTAPAEGQTTIQLDDAAEKKNKVDGNIDEEITNARMRADSGSKSKYSISTDIGYTGGTLARPFGAERPNLAGEPGNQDTTSANIGLNGRYRWSKNDSVTLGTDFGIMTPFQGDNDPNENQFNVSDPSVAYNRVGKIGSLQTTASVGTSFGTSQESQQIDKLGSVSGSTAALYAFKNGLTTGVSLGAWYNFYDSKPGVTTKGNTARPGYYGGDRRTEWGLGVFPFAEYTFNDMFAARTVFGYFNWRHLYGDNDRYRLLQMYVYQSIGVGISVTRDIYLYPNIQFVPDNIRSDFTNVALSATINLF